MALSNHPLALPTIAWAWVMLGNAPTRMVVALPCAHPETAAASQNKSATTNSLRTLTTSEDQGEDAGGTALRRLSDENRRNQSNRTSPQPSLVTHESGGSVELSQYTI